MPKEQHYAAKVVWTGNRGAGTETYRSYARTHEIQSRGKPAIPGSSNPVYRGDADRYNPADLLIASLSACHMLWYLHLCADAGIVVTGYEDDASGTEVELDEGGGHFTTVVLRPRVTVRPGADPARVLALHQRAHELCYIANSVNFPVRHEPTVIVEE